MIDTRVTWRSRESLAEAEAALRAHGRVEIALLPEYHHALWRSLGDGERGQPEVLDVTGGCALLGRISRITNLTELASLSAMLREADVEVRLESPSPLIHIHLRSGKLGTA